MRYFVTCLACREGTATLVWVTNGLGRHVTRFPASDPTKVEKFKTGYSGSGLGIDSEGNVRVTNRLGNSDRGMFDDIEDIAILKTGGNSDEKLTRQMVKQRGGKDGGSVTLLRPDGTQFPGSPFTGARTENCPPGMKTGDQISPILMDVSREVMTAVPSSRARWRRGSRPARNGR